MEKYCDDFKHMVNLLFPTLGKEIKVFSHRLLKQLDILKSVKYHSKFGGAVGNLNSHYYAYPEINWDLKMDEFIKQFNLGERTINPNR